MNDSKKNYNRFVQNNYGMIVNKPANKKVVDEVAKSTKGSKNTESKKVKRGK